MSLLKKPHIKDFWSAYLTSSGQTENAVQHVEAAVAGNRDITDGLIELYLSGKKTAGSSLVRDFECAGDPLPKVGNHWIVLDREEQPKLIVKTIRTEINKFELIPAHVARAEGEGDLSVEYWKKTHFGLYEPFLAKWGIENIDDAEVITEHFEIVFPKQLISPV